jgi:hypothetical protein
VRYEFGCKVSVATTLDEGFVVGMRSFAGNPYDDHILKEALEQLVILTDQRPDLAVVDRGCRGHSVEVTRHPPQSHTEAARRPPPSQRHRSRNRPHEDRWSPVPMPHERHHRRRGLP